MAKPPPLRDFDARLRRAREAEEGQRQWRRRPQGRHGVLGMAFEAATELVGALVVGVGIGWVLDRWLETRPLFLVVFFFFGAAAGGMNVFRRARELSRGSETDEDDGGGDDGGEGKAPEGAPSEPGAGPEDAHQRRHSSPDERQADDRQADERQADDRQADDRQARNESRNE